MRRPNDFVVPKNDDTDKTNKQNDERILHKEIKFD